MSIHKKKFKRLNLKSFKNIKAANDWISFYRKHHPVPKGREYTYHVSKIQARKGHKNEIRAFVKWHNYAG